MMRPRHRSVVLGLLLVGCGTADRERVSVSERDSVGVRIVENTNVDALVEAWTVEPLPLLELGGEGDEALYQVTGAVRMRDGRIVVASMGHNALVVFGPDGRVLRRVGREGEGPGEFRGLFWVGVLPGDSLAAWDVSLQRLQIFTPAGDYARSVAPSGSLGLAPQPQGVLPDGRVVLAAGAGASGVELSGRVQRDTLTYVIMGHDGSLADTVGRFPGTETVALGSPATGFLMRPLPFGLGTVTTVHEGRMFIGTGERYEVAGYDPEGKLRTLFRSDGERVRVTPADVEDYRRNLVTLGGEGDPAAARRHAKLLAEAPYPDRMPSYVALRSDFAGNLWVQEPLQTGSSPGDVWTVFDLSGRTISRVRTPAGLNVLQIGPDWILGVALDVEDVEHVRLYRLTRASSASPAADPM